MQRKYIIHGGKKLSGHVRIFGAKNVSTKAVIAACLTSEPVTLTNVPQISDIDALLDIIHSIGGQTKRDGNTLTIQVKEIKNHTISLSEGARVRTTSLFIAPLLLRLGKALIPNPEGCRIGARPIERHIEGLQKMGAEISYKSEDGYYHATTSGLSGTTYRFDKNTHTGTETLILAAVLAQGKTILENAAEEHEIDDLITLLQKMGADVKRTKARTIEINGVKSLHGATHQIIPDGNETVTFAVLSLISGGEIYLENAKRSYIEEFCKEVENVGGKIEESEKGMRFYAEGRLKPSDVVTEPEPGFKTDWQGPWALLMTQADGESTIHETIYENRFGYVSELQKMGAKIEFFDPRVENPQSVYNFNYDPTHKNQQAIKIFGKVDLHNAVLEMSDLRAGATVVAAALIASGESVISGVEHIERGYENFDRRLKMLGADIQVKDEYK